MGKIDVLIEINASPREAFTSFNVAMESEIESLNFSEEILSDVTGVGLEVTGDFAPIPMFSRKMVDESNNFLENVSFSAAGEPDDEAPGLAAFDSTDENPDMAAETMVVAAKIDHNKLQELVERESVVGVFPNSPITLFCQDCGPSGPAGQPPPNFAGGHAGQSAFRLFDLATSAGGIDCRPFRPAVTIDDIRTLLGVQRIWQDGFRGQNIVVGIIDEGVSGEFYPVIGGITAPNSARVAGSSAVASHGSMCAADILIAAPAAKLYDYPFLGIQNSGGAMAMFQAVLDQRRRDGTPHLTNNSYGFVGIPSIELEPNHEVFDINHPIHRKIREVTGSGCPVLFAAGNCGSNCPSSKCRQSGIGPGRSITAAGSLEEVITVAAVNTQHERIGYSSQGPSFNAAGFQRQKPDISAYSHFFGNFGPGRPAGGDASRFDNGTSAATPVAAGVAALLMSAFPDLTPARLKSALIRGAVNIGPPGWDAETGHGVINAAASYMLLRRP